MGKKYVLLFPSLFLGTTQLFHLSSVKQNKTPRSHETLSAYCDRNDNVLGIKSAKLTKDKADTFVSVKNTNYSHVS